jgi:hypothetical protein
VFVLTMSQVGRVIRCLVQKLENDDRVWFQLAGQSVEDQYQTSFNAF